LVLVRAMPVASPDGNAVHYASVKIQNISVCRQEVSVHPDQDFQPFLAPFYIINVIIRIMSICLHLPVLLTTGDTASPTL
jgi:hypothetical protein